MKFLRTVSTGRLMATIAGLVAAVAAERDEDLAGARGRNVVVFHDLCSNRWFVQSP